MKNKELKFVTAGDSELIRSTNKFFTIANKEDVLELKKKIVNKTTKGLIYDDSLTPLENWLKFICEYNGYKFTLPVHTEIASAIENNREIREFVHMLA